MSQQVPRDFIQRQTTLSGNVVQFCRYLRSKGCSLSTSEEADAMKALASIPLSSGLVFREILRATLAKNPYQFAHFYEWYEDYQFELKRAVDDKVKDIPDKKKGNGKPTKRESFHALKQWLYHKKTDEEITIPTYSDITSLTKKDFSEMTDDEVDLILHLLQVLARRMAHRKSRLKRRSRHRKIPDIRRTIRDNLRRGTELNTWLYSQRKEKRLNIVVICDVSQSMDLYSRFFIQMIYAFQNSYDKIKTFVFSTGLYHLSDLLENHNFDQAFKAIAERVPQWSGGTKIGVSLESFCQQFAHKYLNRKTIVLILSDGWDTGDPEILKSAMHFIKKKARKIIWLNPLAGSPSFEPSALGMQNAMPYVDALAAAHNLESLRKVIRDI